ncbi:glycosyltransferase [Bradyrhizobium diazoefficiens]|jgi:glycosyltransferase involved in cell wall biosynthesis|nr:glycosyltransferase family 2 protein [Bradyrhizobium diazoefficiens]UCF55638.1 MAG: glycosyltransferase [Bradyrhizobium sp.]MBR0966465.1 glycosyltransferase [Bradyrhizobium diazoefficiens]MBR0980081.1 glycosyltransferase [Bradyrhizobium diazoefficiens]MBR1009429.1 glycosyltransferase [Bradyrhizobium diazoefficiens]MBR1016012.1 glycosyltransferase [Bradyrhizobium diazoefficiens]
MDDELRQALEQRLELLENRVVLLERNLDLISAGQRRSKLRSLWRRPPLWTFEQHPPRLLNLHASKPAPAIPPDPPRIAIVTPSYNHAQFLGATIASIISQNYPKLHYHVQDGASIDGTLDLLKGLGEGISWKSEPDAGQSNAINLGFAGIDCDIMAYLNSDDMLLPGTLAYVSNYFTTHPNVDVVYGHRVFVDRDGLEVGRAVLPPHDGKALQYADYIPQETMFWRKRVWDRIGPIDESFHYAMDWDFIMRAQAAGFKFVRLPRFLACFRIHEAQKTASTYAIGIREMGILRRRVLGFDPTQMQIRRAIAPYLMKQLAYHYAYKLSLLRY